MPLDYVTNADLLCVPEYQRKLTDMFEMEVECARRLNIVASDKGLKSPGPGQTMQGKYFVLTGRTAPYASGGSLHRGTSDRFPKSVHAAPVETKWYLNRVTIPWEVDRHTAALMDSPQVTKDMITAMRRCNENMMEAMLLLAEEFVFKGGNGVIATVSAIETYSVSGYTGWKITLDDTHEKWPSQWFVPGYHFCIQDATDVTGAGSLHTPPNGLVVQETPSRTEITCSLHTTDDSWATAWNTVASGDFIKRYIGQDATAAGSPASATDGYKRKVNPWGVPDLVSNSDPTATIDAAAVYAGGTSRSEASILKAQVEYGTSDGTAEVLTLERLRTLKRLCRSRGGTPKAYWCGPETSAELAAQVEAKGRVDWAEWMDKDGVQIGNVIVRKLRLDTTVLDVVVTEKMLSYRGFMLDEDAFLFKMAKPGWYYVGGQNGNIFKHLYPDRDHFAALLAMDGELSCENMAGQGLQYDIKHTQ